MCVKFDFSSRFTVVRVPPHPQSVFRMAEQEQKDYTKALIALRKLETPSNQ